MPLSGINDRSRSAAAEEDGSDHIGLDAPRSGVATPQPDLHDKRLPGIMSYFGQVRPSFKRLLSGTLNASGQAPTVTSRTPAGDLDHTQTTCPSDTAMTHAALRPGSGSGSGGNVAELKITPPLLPHEMADNAVQVEEQLHPYPTPPASQRSSTLVMASDAGGAPAGLPQRTSWSSLYQANAAISHRRTQSLLAPLTSHVNQSSVHAQDFCHTGGQVPATTPSTPTFSSSVAGGPTTISLESATLGLLKKLTVVPTFKSGTATPTRAFSSAQPSHSETTPGTSQENGDHADAEATPVQTASTVAPLPAPKGKLTIKVAEARGLRKCRDPYVVAVFQRSELISGGPHPPEDDDEAAIAAVAMGGIPIQRQASDSGRPAMAIPMRSRQSSNTSITEYTAFRNRTSRRSFTNPKWDAEAAFDVVDSNMHVEISVYDHSLTGEEFLGHVDFQVEPSEKDGPLRGWFTLRGHADTMIENAPTGEIYVEALYQSTERKHFGPDDFAVLRLIGKGTFGQVYQVRKKDTKRIYAMKVLSKKVIVQKKEVAHTVGERNILVRTAMSDSPFIVGLKFSFQTGTDLFLVTDYMSGGELFWHLQKEGRFDEKRAKFYIAELILAIQHLHRNDIVYRDLKPENILLDANGHIALCDFGLSKANLAKNDTTNTFCGTTEYLAPEVLLDEAGYTKMVDFWSLGVLVFEMCCGWSPFYAEDTQQMYKNIAFGKVRFPRDTLSIEGRNFVKGLLNRNPKHRLGATDDAEELKRHGFFSDIDWEALSKKLITPPFKPKLKSDTDVSYFDPEFTNALNTSSSLNERAANLAHGFATSTPLSPSVQANFQGFTYVDESALEDHMKDRYSKYEDEEMDDVDRNKDSEWDDMADIDPRNANRMSGILKSNNNDEAMFGGSQFEP